MYDVDVNGTFNALRAASAAGTPQVLVTTSATAYGAFPDNPEPITEDWPVRGQPTFAYARHKAECDRLCQLWALEHQDRTMTVVRPCIVFGPSVDNYIVRTYLNQSTFTAFRGLPDQRVQFVHEDDVAEAIRRLLDGKHKGAFNVAGDGVLTWRETGERAGMKVRELPFGLVKRLNAALWALRVKSVESPPGNLEFIRHPWLTSNEKLKRTLDWTPRHTSQETFDITMSAHGKGQLSSPAQRTDEASGQMRDPAPVL
jgi:UDP-glucose 4-epimerase